MNGRQARTLARESRQFEVIIGVGRIARNGSQNPANGSDLAEVTGRTVTLKVKFGDFTLISRSKSFAGPVPDLAAFRTAGQSLLAALHPLPKGVRLLGLGLHNLGEGAGAAPLQLGLAI